MSYTLTLNNITLDIHTEPTLFSPKGLDSGSRALLSCAEIRPDDKVLDLGCGCGVVGIYIAKLIGEERVTLLDNDPLAVKTATENAVRNGLSKLRVILSDGFNSLDDCGYTLILSNPPYQTDFKVAKHFIEKGFNRLTLGGRLMMVTKRKDWYKNKLISVFGGVKINEVDGYFVFTAEKRSSSYASK
jgi:16S rRNA (guanine1207-N2)-methyltransferase